MVCRNNRVDNPGLVADHGRPGVTFSWSIFLSPGMRNSGCAGLFLAPSGAQGVTMFVRLSVRSSGPSLSRALNLHFLTLDSSG